MVPFFRSWLVVVVLMLMMTLPMTMTMVMVSLLGNSDSTRPSSERVRVWFPPRSRTEHSLNLSWLAKEKERDKVCLEVHLLKEHNSTNVLLTHREPYSRKRTTLILLITQ